VLPPEKTIAPPPLLGRAGIVAGSGTLEIPSIFAITAYLDGLSRYTMPLSVGSAGGAEPSVARRST
jgi:hypothetical protein